jgi:hypothetical protein
MSFDSARGVTVLFGGTYKAGGPIYDETWEWNGTGWRMAQPQTLPARRYDTALAYDVARQVVVMCSGSNLLADTWEWNGTSWIARSPGSAPPSGLPMVYDSLRTTRGGLWPRRIGWRSRNLEWDGSQWSRLKPAASPPARTAHAMAYDSALGRVVLFGGSLWVGGPWPTLGSGTGPTGCRKHRSRHPRRESSTRWFSISHAARPCSSAEPWAIYMGRTRGSGMVATGPECSLLDPCVGSAQAMAYDEARQKDGAVWRLQRQPVR